MTKFCIITTRSYDFDGTQLDTPFIFPVMYSLLPNKHGQPEVLEFDTFGEAYRYTSRLNDTMGVTESDPHAYRIIPLNRGQKYAEQVVDRYRECKQRKDIAKRRNAVVLNLNSLRRKL